MCARVLKTSLRFSFSTSRALRQLRVAPRAAAPVHLALVRLCATDAGNLALQGPRELELRDAQ